MARYTDTVFDQYGRPVPNAKIFVFDMNGRVPVMANDAGGAILNPILSNASGIFAFNVIDGSYRIEVHYAGTLKYAASAVLIGSSANVFYVLAAGNYFVSVPIGEAATPLNGSFSTDNGQGSVVFYRRTAGGSVEIGRTANVIVGGVHQVSPIGTSRRAFEIASPLGTDPAPVRTFWNRFGAAYTQAWQVISGIYNVRSDGKINIVPPGCVPNLVDNDILSTEIPNYNFLNQTGGMSMISTDVVGPCHLSQNNNNIAGGFSASNIRVLNGGTGYPLGAVLDVSGGTIIPDNAPGINAFFIKTTSVLQGVVTRGTGYVANEEMNVLGGTFTTPARIRVNTVDGVGGILTATLISQGTYTVFPTNVVDTLVTGSTGVGVGARFSIFFPFLGKTKAIVTRIDAGGQVREVQVTRAGLYSAAPLDICPTTSATGTGCTLEVEWTMAARASRHSDYLSGSLSPELSIEAGGRLLFGDPLKNDSRQMHLASCVDAGWFDWQTLGTRAIFRAARGFVSGKGAINQFGGMRNLTLARSLAGGVNNTTEIGRVKFQGGPGMYRITATTAQSVYSWNVPHISSMGSHNEGGAALGGAWAVVASAFNLVSNGQPTLALDVRQDDATIDLAFRLRNLSGSAQVVDVVIEFWQGESQEAGIIARDRFEPSTITATGVAAVTRIITNTPKAMQVRDNYQYAEPATGATVAMGIDVPFLSLNPAATIAALTVNLPDNPTDGQRVTIATTQAITTLSVTATGAAVTSGGVSATLSAGAPRSYRYRGASFAWIIC